MSTITPDWPVPGGDVGTWAPKLLTGLGLVVAQGNATDAVTAGLVASKAAPNGLATLGADSKLLESQLPALAIVDFLGSVASQAAMLALSGQKGDWAVRTDTSTVWIITGATPTSIGSWTQMSYPTAAVTTVAGRTGAVVLTVADISGAAPLSGAAFTTTPTLPTATAGDNTTKAATTAFVKTAVDAATTAMTSALTSKVTGVGITKTQLLTRAAYDAFVASPPADFATTQFLVVG